MLWTDASDQAIGGILRQRTKVIGFFSAKLKPAEANYTVMEKESLGVIRALEHFRYFLYGAKVIIYTNNKNLIFDKSITKQRVQRWKLLMSEYKYEFRHVLGTLNEAADCLSRLNIIEIRKFSFAEFFENLRNQQKNNLEVKTLLDNSTLELLKINNKTFASINQKIYIPSYYLHSNIILLHEELGHIETEKLYRTT